MFLSNIKFNWLTNNYSVKSRYTNPNGILSKAVIKQKKKFLKYIFQELLLFKN